ncbi:MAG: cob(I)yrinic acid a,c-diamide adenosyltransferase [Nitrospirae bacterium]|nr:cob(I)yrinic acid a,c-diamide adenosyltransferase [Nitrospirota bacterium]
MKKGLIHIYTGEGKGKTTAAVGLAVRAKSRGLRVLFAQFMKTRENGGETVLLDRLSITVKLYSEIKSPLFYPDVDIESMKEKTLERLNELILMARDYDVIIIDEFNNLVRSGIMSEEEAIDFIDRFPEDKELVLTGRGATEGMIRKADYVTYMKGIKHPHNKGEPAREGIEF